MRKVVRSRKKREGLKAGLFLLDSGEKGFEGEITYGTAR